MWQLSFELSARTHSPDIASARPRSAHGRFWALRRYRAGWLGKRARCRRRKSPTCGLFSATTSSSANGSLTTLKTKEEIDTLSLRKQAPSHRWQLPRRCWSGCRSMERCKLALECRRRQCSPQQADLGRRRRETTKQHSVMCWCNWKTKTRQMTHTDHMSERTGPYEL